MRAANLLFRNSYGSEVIRFDSRCYDRIGILMYADRTPGQTLSDAFFSRAMLCRTITGPLFIFSLSVGRDIGARGTKT